MTHDAKPAARRPRARRDPEGRRQQIVEAAADVLLQDPARFPHRRVAAQADVPLGSTTQYFATLKDLRAAALHHVAERREAELEAVELALADGEASPRSCATVLHAYLSDRRHVQAHRALYAASADDPQLRPLAVRWSDGLVVRASRHIDPAVARAFAVFADGVMVHANVHDDPLDLTFLTAAIAALMTMAPDERPGTRS